VTAGDRRRLQALLVPADAADAAQVIRVRDSAASISDAIGGHLLDDTITVVLPGGVLAGFYLAEDRQVDLADNPRLAALAARLGVYERAVQSRLRGDVLVLGCAAGPRDDDVPPQVIEACARCGIDVHPASGVPGGWIETRRGQAR
jgi:hypothetical protein